MHKNKNPPPTIYSQNLEIQSQKSQGALVEAKKRESAVKKCCAEVNPEEASSHNNHTYLINYVIEQLKYSHWGSAVRSICCVQKALI